MHRSGTSCITKIFNLNGIKLGNDLLSSQNDNPQGFWEDWYLVKINRQILKRSKGSWDNPPKKIKVSIKDNFTQFIKSLNKILCTIFFKVQRMLRFPIH